MATQKSVEALMAELEAIQAQIKDKKSEVIADIKKKIELFSIVPSDLFAPYSPPYEKQAKANKVKSKSVAKYKHPETGDTWSGKGRAPNWIKDAKGNIKEEYAITKPEQAE